ncbi:MAG: phosphoribosyltransferase family protein [candidate division WOR-3 bacterium]
MSEVLRELERRGALLRGHFLLTSGLHSDAYFEKFRVLESPDMTRKLLSLIADDVRKLSPEMIAGPTTGGILVAFALAEMLGLEAAYAELPPDGSKGRVFRRDFPIRGKRVLVVDDVMTTGGSVSDTIEAVRKEGGVVVGVGLLVDRSGGKDLGVPVLSALRLDMTAWRPEECPLCRDGVPITVRGKGKG